MRLRRWLPLTVTALLVVIAITVGIYNRSDERQARPVESTAEAVGDTTSQQREVDQEEEPTPRTLASPVATETAETIRPIDLSEEEVFWQRVYAFEAAYRAQEPTDTSETVRRRIERYVDDEATLDEVLANRMAAPPGTTRTVVDVTFLETDIQNRTASARARISLVLQEGDEPLSITEESVTTWVRASDADEWLLRTDTD